MKRIAVVLTGAALALTFATSAHAGQNHGSTSTTCPDKQTTTTRVPSSTTSLPSTTSSTVATSSSTTATTEPTSTTSTEATTTTVEATTTTVAETTTTEAATTTVAPDTTIQPSIGDAVTLIPQIGSQGELAETGFPYWNVALLGVGILCLGFAGELIRKMAARS